MEKQFKIIIIGDPTVGKTAFVNRYVNDRFKTGYKGTIGVDFSLKIVKWSNNEYIKLQLWDIAGQERFTSMCRVYYREANACVIIFDLTQKSSFFNAVKWKKDLDSKCTLPDGSPIPCILLANKCDLQQREVSPSEIESFCRENNFIGWTETSAKEGLMVEESMRFLLENVMDNYRNMDVSPDNDTNPVDGKIKLPNSLKDDSDRTDANARRNCPC
jgi:Ras-related protein Rab-7L1